MRKSGQPEAGHEGELAKGQERTGVEPGSFRLPQTVHSLLQIRNRPRPVKIRTAPVLMCVPPKPHPLPPPAGPRGRLASSAVLGGTRIQPRGRWVHRLSRAVGGWGKGEVGRVAVKL